MKDSYNRKIDYLRISLTDLCNLRCMYCMPPEGIFKRTHNEMLSFEQILEIADAFIRNGVRKIRLTGGEPLIKRGILDLCSSLSSISGLQELCVTTNGTFLKSMARDLQQSGVSRINISLDTLDTEKYRFITRGGDFAEVKSGILEALRVFGSIKLNTVLIGGFNDDEIPALVSLTKHLPVELRFIEMMPLGNFNCFPPSAYISCSRVLDAVPDLRKTGFSGVAELYSLPGAEGSVGLIRPLSCSFCAKCNRMRLTADGRLKPCLYSNAEVSVRSLHGETLEAAIRQAVALKPKEHPHLSGYDRVHTARNMNEIGG